MTGRYKCVICRGPIGLFRRWRGLKTCRSLCEKRFVAFKMRKGRERVRRERRKEMREIKRGFCTYCWSDPDNACINRFCRNYGCGNPQARA